MATRVTMQSHYLPADAFGLLGEVFQRHPILASAAVLFSIGAAVVILRRRFGRVGGDIFIVATFLVFVTVFSAACLYLLISHPGYRVFHPGF